MPVSVPLYPVPFVCMNIQDLCYRSFCICVGKVILAWDAVQQGVEDVVHLKGGILKYLEHVAEEESLWEGECFVFDGRVSVRHGLEEGDYDQCFACRRPISEEMKASPDYVPGVSCPHCIDQYSDEERTRFAERQKQMTLAKARGETHLGAKREG